MTIHSTCHQAPLRRFLCLFTSHNSPRSWVLGETAQLIPCPKRIYQICVPHTLHTTALFEIRLHKLFPTSLCGSDPHAQSLGEGGPGSNPQYCAQHTGQRDCDAPSCDAPPSCFLSITVWCGDSLWMPQTLLRTQKASLGLGI